MSKKKKARLPAPLFENQAELTLVEPAPAPVPMSTDEWLARTDKFLTKKPIMRTITINVPDDLWVKLKALAQFRDLPMSHVIALAAKPMVDKLYWEMENDYRAAMRGEKSET